jgi:60 kDa SS-A/Ro ribonucleoprotein
MKGKKMSKLNASRKGTGKPAERLAGGYGAVADRSSKFVELQRSVLACMLWEDVAYENGESVSTRIQRLVPEVDPLKVAGLAIAARKEQKLRHVPLFLAREMARHPQHKVYVADVLENVIQRADELGEFVSIYWKDGKQPLAAQVKKGLARAFPKFDEYQLAKYNRDSKVKLRDVLFLCHPKPQNKGQEELWKKLVNNELKTPDTWEVSLSAGKGENQKQSWERLLAQNKMGAMALIRNLRNFEQADVDRDLVKQALKNCNPEKVLPFRFITAVKHAPRWQTELEELMLRAIEDKKIIKGKTVFVLDVSGSMGAGLSAGSEMNRLECAASLAILARELCEEIVIYATAGNDGTCVHQTALVRPHRGFALRDEVIAAASHLGGGGIFLKQAMDYTLAAEKKADRVIVITDEQDTDKKANPQTANNWGRRNYIVNISVNKNGVAFSKFNHINGFSEAIFDYIAANERLEDGNDLQQALQGLRFQ